MNSSQVVELTPIQQDAIEKLSSFRKYMIIHIYQSGTLLVCMKKAHIIFNKKHIYDYLTFPTYFIETDGQTTKTSTPSYFTEMSKLARYDNNNCDECDIDWFNFKIKHNYNIYNIANENNEVIDVNTIYKFNDWSGYLRTAWYITYGGIIHIEYQNNTTHTVVHIKVKALDEAVKKEMLPLDPVVSREITTALNDFLVKNVIGIVLQY